MQRLIVSLITIYLALEVSAQKPAINYDSYAEWLSLGGGMISSSGKFVSYIVRDRDGNDTSMIRDVNTDWELSIPHSSLITTSELDVHAVFLKSKDSLGVITLGKDAITYIANVSSFKLVTVRQNEWVVYLSRNSTKELVVWNLINGRRISLLNVDKFICSSDGKIVLAIEEMKDNASKPFRIIQWIDLVDERIDSIWKGRNVGGIAIDGTDTRAAFIARSGEEDSASSTIWYYNRPGNTTIPLVNSKSGGLTDSFDIASEELLFNKRGNILFFYLSHSLKTGIAERSGRLPDLTLWNYKDKVLQSQQLLEVNARGKSKTNYLAEINLDSRRTMRLDFDGEWPIFIPRGKVLVGDFLLSFDRRAPDDYYRTERRRYMYLISLNDGSRKKLPLQPNARISTNEHFVTWFDDTQKSYFAYEISTGILRNISKSVHSPLYDEDAAKLGRESAFGIGAWLPNDRALLLYDRYDIWRVDPTGIDSSVNITKGYGHNHETVFSVVNDGVGVDSRGKLLLAAYSMPSKMNGFWAVDIEGMTLVSETMGSFEYYIPRINKADQIDISYAKGWIPIKSKNANCWIVIRGTVRESPNLFFTKDFKVFKQISHVNPEKGYNWMTADLIKWRMPDGKISQGILYKPENFDSGKKYPVIFNYYGKRSDEFNEYLTPDFARGDIDIPTFVSNGYLIFVPDIYYSKGHNGQSVLNAVMSAARYLMRFSWIDSTRLGLQGHSFGGWETNYLITHSHLFRAACEASGACDGVSSYGELDGVGVPRQELAEQTGQGAPYGVGVTPWTNPRIYIENSPIFYLGNVNTPLLMMHGKRDGSVPFEQAVELYMGLRRAGKKVWLLQYNEEGHILRDNRVAKDYTIRGFQFFSYYLKGERPPKWMTEGIPAEKKDFNDGLELDCTENLP